MYRCNKRFSLAHKITHKAQFTLHTQDKHTQVVFTRPCSTVSTITR